MITPGSYQEWLNESTKALFAEFDGMKPEEIVIAMKEEGFCMFSPMTGKSNDINHTCVTAQFLMKRTGRRVCCGTTTFNFEDNGEEKTLRYYPDNVVLFNWMTWTGKTPELYNQTP